MAYATLRHSSTLRPRSTRTVTNLVAPSPSRTIACARLRATSVSAASSLSASRPEAGAGPLPVAARIRESLVEVSPSTLMQLNDRSATRSSSSWRFVLERRASVAMKPSIVAMSGRIMPAPLAMPVTRISPFESLTFLEKAFGTVSVVMIASAADSQSLLASSALGSAAMMRSAGSGSMMTPVENGSTSSTSQPRWPASASQTCSARFTPSSPVPALALPVLTTSAVTLFGCFFARRTGAAQKRFWVNTPATAVPGARRMTSRSLRPGFLTPAIATPSSTPGMASSESGFGKKRLTATVNEMIRHHQDSLPWQCLYFLPERKDTDRCGQLSALHAPAFSSALPRPRPRRCCTRAQFQRPRPRS